MISQFCKQIRSFSSFSFKVQDFPKPCAGFGICGVIPIVLVYPVFYRRNDDTLIINSRQSLLNGSCVRVNPY